MKKKEHKKIYSLLTGALLLTVTTAFVIFMFSYIRTFDGTLLEENRSHLAETANHIIAYTHSTVQDTEKLLLTVGDIVKGMEEGERLSCLMDMTERQEFAYAGYAGKDGMLHATEPSQDRDISGEAYYRQAMKGQTVITGLTRRVLKSQAVSGVVVAVPMTGADGETQGMIGVLLDTSRLGEALQIGSFGGHGYSYIIDTDGELVLHNKSMDYNNFYRVLANVKIRDGSAGEIEKSMRSGGSGLIEYEQLGVEQYAYYCPLGLNDWTVVNIVSKEAVTRNTRQLTRQLVIVSVLVIVVFLILLGTVALTFIISQNQRHEAEIKTAFLSNMSHEIRTPINAVVGISEILLKKGLPKTEENYVASIQTAGKGLLTFVDDMLELSGIQFDEIRVTEEPYALKHLLEELTTNTVVRIDRREVTFLVEVEETVPAMLIGDSLRVRQILLNLIGHAVNRTQEGSIRVSLRTESVEPDKTRLIIRVEVIGATMAEEDRERLFSRLSIVRSLCGMMDGNVTLERETGKGMVFTVDLLQRSCGKEPLLTTHFPEAGRVLILEEDETLLSFYEACLKRTDLSFRLCADGETFRKALSKGGYGYALVHQEALQALPVHAPEALAVDASHPLPEDSRSLDSGQKSRTVIGILLKQKKHSLLLTAEQRLTVYAPLFGLQLAHLSDRPETGRPLQFPFVRVLVVDDNSLNLEIAESLLTSYGMQVDCASSGREALSRVQKNRYDMVFLDYMMPDMDGVETLKAIRGLPEEEFHRLPVVALTANATKEAQKMYAEAGFNEFLSKPIDMKRVEQILNKWLRKCSDERAQTDPGAKEMTNR